MDELVRQKLQGYEAEPPAAVWDSIQRGYTAQMRRGSGFRHWLSILLLAVVVIIPASNVHRNPAHESGAMHITTDINPVTQTTLTKTRPQASPGSEPYIQTASKPASDDKTPITMMGPEGSVQESKATRPGGTYPKESTPRLSARSSKQNPVTSPAIIADSDHAPTVSVLPETSRPDTEPPSALQINDPVRFLSFIRSLGLRKQKNVIMQPRDMDYTILKDLEKKKGLQPQWSIGLFYTPELYHSASINAERTLLGFESILHLRMRPYAIETGLGFSQVSNDNLFTIDYHAYLGKYKDLDSIQFTYDPVSQTIIPQYFFNEVAVYDTATQTYYTRMKNAYTYLQVPLMISYTAPLQSSMQFNVRGGLLAALMIGSREPDAYFDVSTNRIVRIQDRTPGRVRTSYQFLLNTGVSMPMTRHLHFSLEPGIRLHLNPIYEQDGHRPWSVNLRMGVLYQFK